MSISDMAGVGPDSRREDPRSPSIPVCSPDYLARAGKISKPSDLLKLNLLHIMGVDDGWDRLLGDSGPIPNESYAMDTSLAALELACIGAGVALVFCRGLPSPICVGAGWCARSASNSHSARRTTSSGRRRDAAPASRSRNSCNGSRKPPRAEALV